MVLFRPGFGFKSGLRGLRFPESLDQAVHSGSDSALAWHGPGRDFQRVVVAGEEGGNKNNLNKGERYQWQYIVVEAENYGIAHAVSRHRCSSGFISCSDADDGKSRVAATPSMWLVRYWCCKIWI